MTLEFIDEMRKADGDSSIDGVISGHNAPTNKKIFPLF